MWASSWSDCTNVLSFVALYSRTFPLFSSSAPIFQVLEYISKVENHNISLRSLSKTGIFLEFFTGTLYFKLSFLRVITDNKLHLKFSWGPKLPLLDPIFFFFFFDNESYLNKNSPWKQFCIYIVNFVKSQEIVTPPPCSLNWKKNALYFSFCWQLSLHLSAVTQLEWDRF